MQQRLAKEKAAQVQKKECLYQIKLNEESAQNSRDILQADFDFKKSQLAEKDFIARKRQEVIGNIYYQTSIGSLDINVARGKDPIAALVDNYIGDSLKQKHQ